MKRLILAGLVAFTLATTPVHAEEIKELHFGLIATESSSGLSKTFQPLIDDLQKALGIPVKAYFAQDYAGVIEGMRFKKVDIAWFGNKSAMEAVDRAGGEVFAQTSKPDGTKGYYSLLVANKSRSDINGLKDVLDCSKGWNFANGDVNSTSGYLVPGYYVFAMHNVTPTECYKRVVNGNHESNALAVANGQVDFATTNSEMMERLEQNRPQDLAKIKEVWRSPLIPNDPMVWRSDLPADMKAKIYAFFIGYGRLGSAEEVKHARDVLAHTSDGWGVFEPSSNAQLYPIRQLELFKNKLQLQNSDKVSADEKKAQIAKIDAELAEIDKLQNSVPNM